MVTVGAGRGSQRSASVWDLRALKQAGSVQNAVPLSTHYIDSNNATAMPLFDRDHQLLLVASAVC